MASNPLWHLLWVIIFYQGTDAVDCWMQWRQELAVVSWNLKRESHKEWASIPFANFMTENDGQGLVPNVTVAKTHSVNFGHLGSWRHTTLMMTQLDGVCQYRSSSSAITVWPIRAQMEWPYPNTQQFRHVQTVVTASPDVTASPTIFCTNTVYCHLIFH